MKSRNFFIALTMLVLFSSITFSAENKTALLVVSPEYYLESEYENTRAELEKAGITVKTASITTAAAYGYGSGKILPDIAVKDASAGNYSAIVIIGGRGASQHLWELKDLHKLLNDAYGSERYVAAICAAPPVLTKAGILKNNDNATMWPDSSWIRILESGGAHYVDEPVVVSGRIITAKNPAAANSFGKKIAELILSR